jgi:hypothetical protein
MINKTALLIAYAVIVMGSVTMMVVLQRHGAPLKKAGHQIGELELACSSTKAKTIIDDWGPHLTDLALEDIRFDYAFIALYTAALALTGFYGAIVWGGILRGWLARAGTFLGWAMFVAGLMDVFEDLGMAAEIGGNYAIAPLVCTVSAIKWFIAIAAFVYAVPTLLLMLVRLPALLRINATTPSSPAAPPPSRS